MTSIDKATIERFMHGQADCWNRGDRAGFMAHYREMAPEQLDIGYAGRQDPNTGWFIIEEMWDKHNAGIQLEVVEMIINGSEVAVHHRNCIKGTSAVIESIETYRFEPGRLSIVYFLKPPAEAVELEQFRGFAAA